MTDQARPAEEPGTERRAGLLARLRTGLARSSRRIAEGVAEVFVKRRLDEAALEELEELLIMSDLGVAAAAKVTRAFGERRLGKDVTPDEVKAELAREVAGLLAPLARPLDVDPAHRPFVILVVGVNGTGKTTTIGKLAHLFRREGRSVLIAAADTFRAAAIDQLEIWGARAGVPVLSGKIGGDAAGVAYDAFTRARAEETEILLVDTAGRLQNKADLMAELEKIRRVLARIDATAPHATLLVLDATTGQNALNQVDVFREIAQATGIVMTKLDGTARGGILVAAGERSGLPIHAVGVGEGIEDLQPFDADAFARALCGVED